MEFDLNEDQREIQRTARDLLVARATPDKVRHAGESRTEDRELWAEVSELGWPGIAVGEDHGGLGLGLVELSILLEETGAVLAPIPLLPTAAAALVIEQAGSDDQRAAWLERLAAGEITGGIGLASADGSSLVAAGADAEVFVVVGDGRARLYTREAAEPLHSIDPLRHYVTVSGDGEELPGDATSAEQAVAVAIAAELTGVSRRALEMTVDYVKERKQFGIPVGAFQAVSHRCAEMLLAVESGRSAYLYAAWAADASPEELPAGAAIAKSVASDGAVEVGASAIQMHGGIGFTWEADVHWLYKRAQLGAQLLGGAGTHRAHLADLMAASVADRVA